MIKDEMLELMGDPEKAIEEMEIFRETVRVLSSSRAQLVERYPRQWIALHSGEVRASGPTLEAVLEKLDAEGFSRDQAIVRYMDPDPTRRHYPSMRIASKVSFW